MWISSPDLARSPGHRFYEKLNELLSEAKFDRRAEAICAPYFEADDKPGRPSIPPGVYFRMLFVGYFEGIESERGLEWRCSDSLSLRTFLGVQVTERVPDHSSLSRMRTRLDGEVYDEVFRFVLGIVESKGLLRGKVAGVDSTYLRADASMKSIVRKDTGDDYTTYLKKLCEAQGIENPTVEDARRMDRARKGKKVSNEDWASPTDADARIVRLKDGRTRLGYKAEHVVDLDTGAVVAAEVYSGEQADTATLRPSLEAARDNVNAARAESTRDDENDDDDDSPPSVARPGPRTMTRLPRRWGAGATAGERVGKPPSSPKTRRRAKRSCACGRSSSSKSNGPIWLRRSDTRDDSSLRARSSTTSLPGSPCSTRASRTRAGSWPPPSATPSDKRLPCVASSTTGDCP